MAKRKRRGSGEGSRPVRQRNGRYKVTRTLDWKSRKRESRTFDTIQECYDWLAEKRLIKDAAASPEVTMLLADWIESWLGDVKKSQARTTFQSYKYHLDSFVAPNLGSIPVRDLKPLAIRNLFSELDELNIGQGTLQKLYAALHSCLESAAKLEVISRNPVSQVSRPKGSRKDINPFTVEEVISILEFVENHRLFGLFVVAFHLGLRQGELFALEWSDLDEENQTLSIERQIVFSKGGSEIKKPKTKAGARVLDLAPETLNAILERRKIAMTEKLARCKLIFPGIQGGYLHRSTFGKRVWKEEILDKLKIPRRGMHHCRHTFASIALANGEALPDVAKILGHADPSITLRIYAHAVEGGQRKTVERVAKLFSTPPKRHL